MYTSDGKYIGYSMNKHACTEYTSPKAFGKQWAGYIVLNSNVTGEPNEYFVYDAYNNLFVPLTLTTEHGSQRIAWPGGKTAFIATSNGYLFAYKPGVVVSVDEENDVALSPDEFKLYQNYPNPFESSTNIVYQIPEDGFVVLKVYDLLGREIETLMNTNQTLSNKITHIHVARTPRNYCEHLWFA